MFVRRGYLSLTVAVERLESTLDAEAHDELAASLKGCQTPKHISHLKAQLNDIRAARMPPSLFNMVPRSTPPPDLTTEEEAEVYAWNVRGVERDRRLDEARRRLDALRARATLEMRQALGEGDLVAEVLGEDGELRVVPVTFWRTERGEEAMRTGRVMRLDPTFGARVVGDVSLDGRKFLDWASKTAKAETGPTSQTIASERRLVLWLTEQMKASLLKPIPKQEMAKRAETDAHTFSNKGFDRAWTVAVRESGATAWSQKGRRPKSPP